jgi:acylphosphatase
MKQIGAKFVVRGHVQGVGFRYFVLREANSLGLKGYTRNEYDGSVVVYAEGEEGKVLHFADLLSVGPSRAHVERVIKEIVEFTGDYTGFNVM